MESMQYRFLGDTGIRVSVLGYGFMDFEDQSLLDEMLPHVIKLGVNYIDVAEIYGSNGTTGYGLVESLLGNSLKKLDVAREDLVISTKFITGGNTVNRKGLSYKHLIEGMNRSLKNLQLDYVDVAFAHRDDKVTPMEEICRGFNTMIEDGQAFHWATSEWPADRIMEAFDVCDKLGLIRPIADQAEYNMLTRDKMENQFSRLFETYHYGTTIWSPLAAGILTGKYNNEIPEGSRLTATNMFAKYMGKYMKDGNIDNIRGLLNSIQDVSKEVGCSMSQLALAWALKNKDVSTAIIGSRKPAQLEENGKALEYIDKITPEIEEKLEKLLNNRPDPGMDFRTRSANTPRRVVATL